MRSPLVQLCLSLPCGTSSKWHSPYPSMLCVLLPSSSNACSSHTAHMHRSATSELLVSSDEAVNVLRVQYCEWTVKWFYAL